MEIAVNTRVLAHPGTGIQRYLEGILKEAPAAFAPRAISPHGKLNGIEAHLWEQLVLPARARGLVLWSPANTGPIAHKSQVITIHDLAPLDHPEWFTKRFALLYRTVLPSLVKNARHIITVSEFTRDRLYASLSPRAPITVVPAGVAPQFRPSHPDAIAKARRDLGIPPGDYILSLGSIEPRKNLPALLRAWALLDGRISPGINLVIAGAPGSRRVFNQPSTDQASKSPTIHYIGRVADEALPPLYSGALAFCFPSLYEGFGSPPLEAMACGTPVITSTAHVFQETLGDAAIRADCSKPEILANAIFRLTRDHGLRNSLSAAGPILATNFSYKKTAHQTIEILRAEAQS